MSVLVYDNITLNYFSTLEVRYDPVMDDLAGVDYECTRISIVGTCIVGPGSYNGSPESATAQMKRFQHQLNTPRRGLTFKVNGETLVSTVEPGGDTTVPIRDVRNGPYASATVTRIMGTECLMVVFRVETYRVDCPEGTGGTPVYVSHRWNTTADVNELALTRRTISGRIVARADIVANADALRGLAGNSFPLENGFLRVSSRYNLQADGRVLAYEFVDQEQYLMPPNPAAKAEGRFSITCKDGASYWAECALRLQGGKPTDKTVLIKRAMAIALAKITNANPPSSNGGFILTGTISEDMFANDVSVRLSAMVQPTKSRMTAGDNPNGGLGSAILGLTKYGGAGLAIGAISKAIKSAAAGGNKAPGLSAPANLDAFKVPKEYDKESDFAPGTRGSAQLLLISAALQDPCWRQTVLSATGSEATVQTTPGQTAAATITISDSVPDETSSSFRTGGLSTEPDGVYEIYSVQTRDTEDLHVLAMPIASKNGGTAVFQTGSPTTYRRVTWTVTKVGSIPATPDPQLSDTKWVLVKKQREVDQVEPIADGAVLRFTVAGCFDYVRQQDAGTTQTVNLTAAVPPWVDQSLALPFAVSPFGTVKGILEPWLGLTGFILQSGGSLSTLGGLGGTGGPIIPGVNG